MMAASPQSRSPAPLPVVSRRPLSGTARSPSAARQRRLSSTIWLSISLIWMSIWGASAQLDPVKNFCRRFGHQTAVIDRRLFIDGGLINYNPISQYPSNYSNTQLLYQDLNTLTSSGMPQLYANLTKNSSIPDVSGGILWADDVNKRFYLFGGEYYQQPPAPFFTLWSYDALYDVWDSFGMPSSSAGIQSVSYGAGTAISSRGEGYYYGGWVSNSSVLGWSGPSVATGGLIKYEMDGNTFTNNTGPDSVRRAEGAMVYIPVGDGGMLVYFGGIQDLYGNGTATGQPMNDIYLYDVLSGKWYLQEASGQTPQMRRRFCAGAAWAADQSSYNIYLYGGAGFGPNVTGFDDVYILTIPSFQWIKLYPNDGNVTGSYPHHSLTCNVISGAQMLIIGGTFPTSNSCDAPDQYGQHNLDMGEQNPEKAPWQLFVPNLTTYAVPDPIIKVIGGNGAGGATKTAPAAGFSNPDLNVLMTRKASVANRTPTRAITTNTGSPDNSGQLSTGAIVGIAVGAVALAILGIVGCCVFIRRHRRRRMSGHGQEYPGGAGIGIGASPAVAWSTPHSPHSTHTHTHPGYSPTTPYSAGGGGGSSFMRRTSRQSSAWGRTGHPAELDAQEPPVGGGVNIWQGPDGVTYELVSPGHQGNTLNTYGTGGSNTAVNQPQTKIDSEGRVWMQVTPTHITPTGTHSSSSPGSPTNTMGMGHRYPSIPGGGGGGGGGGNGGYMAVAPNSPPQQPQELSSDPQYYQHDHPGQQGGGEQQQQQEGWDAAHGRPQQHQTYYHP